MIAWTSRTSDWGTALRGLVIAAGLSSASLAGCQATGPERVATYVPPAPPPYQEPQVTLTARETARQQLRLTRPPGAPVLMPPPTAAVLAPARHMSSTFEAALSPYTLGDEIPLPSAIPEDGQERFAPGPMMPPLVDSRLPAPTLPPASETIPDAAEPAVPRDMKREAIASLEFYELRLAAVEQQLVTSQAALQAVTSALQLSQADITQLRGDVADAQNDVHRLEELMESRHRADIESLGQLSGALDSLIRRTEERSASQAGIHR
ncbi:MAG: hypothetical protein KDA75_06990 [Planctomycetaceae bacterium]|nr:hypothetical protein [Planctomycetaceae bacterium]